MAAKVRLSEKPDFERCLTGGLVRGTMSIRADPGTQPRPLMPRLSRITIYPLKSFDGLVVEEARVLSNGALQHDRQFALVDPSGMFINAKHAATVHGLQLQLDPVGRSLTARRRSHTETVCWNIDSQSSALERWLSNYFELEVRLIEEPNGGFPDDTEATGPTILSAATWSAIAEWFPGLTVENVRDRFRANLEVEDAAPFWEDHLFQTDATPLPFCIGSVLFSGTNPCQRCIVPTRDPATGEVWSGFAHQFATMRAEQLPTWAARERFNHFYRLTTNTRLIERRDGTLRVGDDVRLV